MKEQTGNFWFSKGEWENLQEIANIIGVSKSRIVERVILAKETGYARAEQLTKKRAKKISYNKRKHQKASKVCTQRAFKQECLFEASTK